MKAIMISIRPQHVANILNGIKTLEIRKMFPSDYVGWVYIYVTKQGILAKIKNVWRYIKGKNYNPYFGYQGKVAARFWCDKVEEIRPLMCGNFYHFEYGLTTNQLNDYLNNKSGKAIHIAKLEPFDKPKEISEFSHYDNSQYQALPNGEQYKGVLEPLTRAPQSWQFIEV